MDVPRPLYVGINPSHIRRREQSGSKRRRPPRSSQEGAVQPDPHIVYYT